MSVAGRLLSLVIVLLAVVGAEALAASYKELQARRPELFHPETGFRVERQRAPTPDDIPPPSKTIDADEAARLLDAGALALDVFGALQSRYDELDGTWLVSKRRSSLPGAIWLPETGRGTLNKAMQAYLTSNLKRLAGGDPDRPIVVFCVADCWMSWNAAQRISGLGYKNVHWLRHGIDAWLDTGRTLEPVDPVPVNADG